MQKIMFNDKHGLTEAVLQGRKTLTRRVINGLPSEVDDLKLCDGVLYARFIGKTYIRAPKTAQPRYKVGEVVAIAQSYKDAGYTKEWVVQHVKPTPKSKPTDPFEKRYPGWNNKMFVKAEFMPNFIQFTDLKAERLRDISDVDCLKEGVFQWGDPFHEDRVEDFGFFGATKHYKTAISAFAALIDKVSGRGTWVRTPWVFAYSYELVK